MGPKIKNELSILFNVYCFFIDNLMQRVYETLLEEGLMTKLVGEQ